MNSNQYQWALKITSWVLCMSLLSIVAAAPAFTSPSLANQLRNDPPRIIVTRPANREVNVITSTGIAADIWVPPLNGNGVDDTTLTSDTVYLYPTGSDPTTSKVDAALNTTGGNDAITLTPMSNLAINTNYTFVVTSGVTDQYGNPFTPFTMSFTTGTSDGSTPTPVQFTRVAASPLKTKYTSLAIGPDNRLYAATIKGLIRIFDINSNGTLTLDRDLTMFSGRAIIGLVFDPASTPANLILWVSNNNSVLPLDPVHFSGRINRLIGTNPNTVNEVWSNTTMIDGLPRSRKDHLANSLAFGPDGGLYLTIGSISAMGAPDNSWGNQPETVLAGAVLRIDTTRLQNVTLPLNVATGTVDVNNQFVTNYGFGELNGTGLYDPQAAGAPVTVWASGVRNAYDLMWHTNGQLYVPTNGSAAGGNVPGIVLPLSTPCNHRLDGVYNGSTTNVPAVNNVATQKDYLFRVVQGGYYGHPNPKRCEWVLNGGNPTSGPDLAEVSSYPVGVMPDPNYRGFAFDFGTNRSPNGIIEYRTNIYDGALRGDILVVRYSQGDDIIVLLPGGPNLDIVASMVGITGFTGFFNPLDLVEDRRNGNLYVAEYESESNEAQGELLLLRPVNPNAAPLVQNDHYNMIQANILSVNVANGVLANDSDSNLEDTLSALLWFAPDHADSFALNPDGSFVYVPQPNFVGTDSFQYKVSDGQTSSLVATVLIQVAAGTPTLTFTATHTPTRTPTTTLTPSATHTPTPSFTPTDTLTATPTTENPTATLPQSPTTTPEATATESAPLSLLVNGGFEDDVDANRIPDGWKLNNLVGNRVRCNKNGKIFAQEGECAFQIKGGLIRTRLQQSPDHTVFQMGDVLTLELWVKGKSVVAKGGNARLVITYTDGTIAKPRIDFPSGTYAYTQFSVTSDPLVMTVSKARVQLTYSGVSGRLWLDDVRLSKSTTESSMGGLIPLP